MPKLPACILPHHERGSSSSPNPTSPSSSSQLREAHLRLIDEEIRPRRRSGARASHVGKAGYLQLGFAHRRRHVPLRDLHRLVRPFPGPCMDSRAPTSAASSSTTTTTSSETSSFWHEVQNLSSSSSLEAPQGQLKTLSKIRRRPCLRLHWLLADIDSQRRHLPCSFRAHLPRANPLDCSSGTATSLTAGSSPTLPQSQHSTHLHSPAPASSAWKPPSLASNAARTQLTNPSSSTATTTSTVPPSQPSSSKPPSSANPLRSADKPAQVTLPRPSSSPRRLRNSRNVRLAEAACRRSPSRHLRRHRHPRLRRCH